jgi:hypothetical protein
MHPRTGTGLLSSPILQRLWARLLGRQRFVNLSVSNVKGSPVPLYLAGARLLELFPIAPLVGNMPVGVAVLSYAGQLNVTLIADPEACPDLDVVAGGVRAALDELLEPADDPAASASPPPS